jgi:cytochrome c oxidase cbb3-type subunit III
MNTTERVFSSRMMLCAVLLACVPMVALSQAPTAQTTAPASAAAPAPGSTPAIPARARAAQSTREFLGLGPVPDAVAAKRGAPLYTAHCALCHGPLARGAQGPSLIYSEMVLKDEHGVQLAEFLKTGLPGKGMPAFPTLDDTERRDVAEFVHQLIEDVANRGTYEVKNILLGDAAKGAQYVAARCLQCHSISGDLKGIGAKWRPVDLQRYWIMPPRNSRNRAITATVRTASGEQRGRVEQIDDFRILLAADSGPSSVIVRDADVTVQLHDPLAPHVAMIGELADADMINVTAYLESLK